MIRQWELMRQSPQWGRSGVEPPEPQITRRRPALLWRTYFAFCQDPEAPVLLLEGSRPLEEPISKYEGPSANAASNARSSDSITPFLHAV